MTDAIRTGGGGITPLTLRGKPQPGETAKKGEYTLAPDICNCNTGQIVPALKKNGFADVIIAKDEYKNAWITAKKLDFRDAKGKPVAIPAIGQQISLKTADGQTFTGTVKYSDKD
ncbi:MAG: hypothetical protein H7338_08550 [Candidatus Sericytochromatia bacterium]|nr:hypothetical protein [Candidatus Sericytochromatia bacterium]